MKFKTPELRRAAIERLSLNEDFRMLMGELLNSSALPSPFRPSDPCAEEYVRGKKRAAWYFVEMLMECKQGALLIAAIAKDFWLEMSAKTEKRKQLKETNDE